VSDRLARCDRCGAPASRGADRGGRLVPRKGYRGVPLYSARRRGGHRRPIGYVHADRAFCDRRMPPAIRAKRKAKP